MTDLTASTDCCSAEPVAPPVSDLAPAPLVQDVAVADPAPAPVSADVAAADPSPAPVDAPPEAAPATADFSHDPSSWMSGVDGGQPTGPSAADFSHDPSSWISGVDGGQPTGPSAADFSSDTSSWQSGMTDAHAAPDPGLQFPTSSWMQEVHGGGAPATASFGDFLGSKWSFDDHLGVAHPTWADADGDLIPNWLDHHDGAYGA